MRAIEFITEGNTELPGVYTHNTSPENVERIKMSGFKFQGGFDRSDGVYFNKDKGSYTGGAASPDNNGYGEGEVHIRFTDEVSDEHLFNTDNPSKQDMANMLEFTEYDDPDEAWDKVCEDGDELYKFCTDYGYAAWFDDIQICVVSQSAIKIVDK